MFTTFVLPSFVSHYAFTPSHEFQSNLLIWELQVNLKSICHDTIIVTMSLYQR